VDSTGAEGNDESRYPTISADGRFVAFSSYASNLVAGDSNGGSDVFVHDRANGITERVSVDSSGAEGNSDSWYPSISADGQVVAFYSAASNLVAGDMNGSADVFVHDRATGTTERMSIDSSGIEGDQDSRFPSISADGQIVAFDSGATNLVAGDTNGCWDVFVHDRTTGSTERVSVSSSGKQGNSGSEYPSSSADGRVIAFYTNASSLVFGDKNGADDVFVHDRATGITERVSVDSSGAEGNGQSYDESISADGLAVVFTSTASNVVAGDTNGSADVFIRDRSTGITERMSMGSSGAEGNGSSLDPTISPDAQIVAFDSYASNLDPSDTNTLLDDFVHERCSITASWTNYGSGFPGTNGIPSLTSQQNPSFGATITLVLTNSLGAPTFGLLFIGFQRGSFNTKYGGQLLVVPSVIAPISFSYGADSFTGTIPDDVHLCGVTVDLQGIEADPGAANGVSFTPGLELVLGN
jgi:cold shock CspA family protein